MAVNIVDRDKLDAALTATASAIRSKTGSSGSIAFDMATDMGFKSAIESIPSGGLPEWLMYVETLNGKLYTGATAENLPETMTIELPNAIAAPSSFFNASSTSCRHIIVIYKENAQNILLSSYAGGSGFKPQGVEKVTLRAGTSEVIKVTNTQTPNICNANSVKELDCVLDLSLYTYALSPTSGYAFGSGMETFRVKPNTMVAKNNNFSNSPALTDNTLINLANGLKAGNATLTLHTTSKGRLTAILGTVSQITDDTGTYDFFTADAGGSTTLQNFITQTKGWTIA